MTTPPSIDSLKTQLNTDTLSYPPLQEVIDEPFPPGDMHLFDTFPGPPLTAATISQIISKDLVLSRPYCDLQAGTVVFLLGDYDFRLCVHRPLTP